MNKHDAEFDQFAHSAWPRLRWSAYLLCGDYHLAEDLAQTALIRTYAHWRGVRRDDALAYARRVLVNLNIDRLRRRRPQETPDPDSRIASAALISAGSEEELERREEVVRLLAGLTQRERQVVVLRHYFNLTEAEVGHELGIALGTVKSANARALAKLRTPGSTPATARPAGSKKGPV